MNFEVLIQSLPLVFQPFNFSLIIIGMTVGLFFGALPGISSSMGIVLMLPFTYSLGVIPSVILLASLYAGSAYGGSITAILFNTPGTPEAAATTFDGYPMAQKGQAGRALGLAVTASAVGGIVSVSFLILLAPILSQFALKIQSPEYFALTVLGLACIASIGASNTLKALVSGITGVLIAMIGIDPMTGSLRYTLGRVDLMNGLEFIPIMIGAFAVAEVLNQVSSTRLSPDKESDLLKKVSLETISLKDILTLKYTLIKSALIGTLIGILPGTGGSIASVVSYGEATRSSDKPEEFGTGKEEGVVAPEAANNAAAGGAMIPTLVLGIPGSPTTAIILAALILQGLQPGPRLMHEQPLLLYSIAFAMLLSSVGILFAGRYVAKAFAAVLKLPYFLIGSFIVLLSAIGSYGVSNNTFEIWVMIVFGVFGYFMKKYNYSPAALILGVILGNLMEENFRRSLLLSDGDPTIFLTRPISILILGFALFSILLPIIQKREKNSKVGK
jgi:putative tricarboxylic transport membrane protein